jgi:hypothetical protein
VGSNSLAGGSLIRTDGLEGAVLGGGVTQLFDLDDTRLLVRDLIDPRDMNVSLG